MLRLMIPVLLITGLSWALLYGLRPKFRPLVWSSIRHALVAVSIGVGVGILIAGIAALSITGGIHLG